MKYMVSDSRNLPPFKVALEINRCLHGAYVSNGWPMEISHYFKKDLTKRATPNNYRPITCLPIRKILTKQTSEEIYYSLTSHVLFSEKQKGCCKASRGTAGLTYIDQHIQNESKIRWKYPTMAWIDNKKAYDIVPQSWMIHCLIIYKISYDVINFIEKNMKTLRVELTAGGRRLAEAKIQRGIFQGDTLSSFLFIIAMMPLYPIRRKYTDRYKLSRTQGEINHLIYRDDIKMKKTGNTYTRS